MLNILCYGEQGAMLLVAKTVQFANSEICNKIEQ